MPGTSLVPEVPLDTRSPSSSATIFAPVLSAMNRTLSGPKVSGPPDISVGPSAADTAGCGVRKNAHRATSAHSENSFRSDMVSSFMRQDYPAK